MLIDLFARASCPSSEITLRLFRAAHRSDEPATAACGNAGGQFWCVNKGHHGKFLFASFVNDGVCDCCDGSDEDGSLAQCSNRCEDVGREIRRQLERQIELHEKGHLKRAEYAERGAKFRAGVVARKSELEGLMASLDVKLAEMGTRKSDLEAVTEAQRAEKEAAEQAKKEAEEAAAAAAAAEAEAANVNVHASEDSAGSAAADPQAPQQVDPPVSDSEQVDEGQAVEGGEQQVDLDEPAAEGEEAAAAAGEAVEEEVAEVKSEEQVALDALLEEMKVHLC